MINGKPDCQRSSFSATHLSYDRKKGFEETRNFLEGGKKGSFILSYFDRIPMLEIM